MPSHVCKHAKVKIRGLKAMAAVDDNSVGIDGSKAEIVGDLFCALVVGEEGESKPQSL